MSYEKQTWVNGVSPLNAERLNHMEEGIHAVAGAVEELKQNGTGGGSATETVTASGVVLEMDLPGGCEITINGKATEAVTLVHHGKNFAPTIIETSKTINGLTWSLNEDGSVHITGTATANTYISFSVGDDTFILPSGSYLLSCGGEGMASGVFYVAVQPAVSGAFTAKVAWDGQPRAFDVPTDAVALGYIYVGSGQTVDTDVWYQIELGAVESEYEPYKGESYSGTLPTTLSAYEGTNIIYTTAANELTAVATIATGGGINKDAVNALIAEAMKFDPVPYGLPVFALNGDCTGMTKDDYVSLAYTFQGRSGTVQVKKQGTSSINAGTEIGAAFDTDVGGLFNFTLKFPEAFEAKEGWGAQTKYCFKANAIDHSHARNICSCKLWGEVVKSRANVPAELSSLPNGGAIDGFPIVVMLNDKYYALGTFNIPKDGWMFGAPKAVLSAAPYGTGSTFKTLGILDTDFEIEYAEDEANTDWILTSLNAGIQAVIDSDGSDLDTVIAQHFDLPSAIDYYIHCVEESASDGLRNNYLLVTYDGKTWYFSAYDRDTTYGLEFNGLSFRRNATGDVTFATAAEMHRLLGLIYNNKKADLKARAVELRSGVKSENNVYYVFTNFTAGIPAELLAQNCRRWPLLRSTSASNLAQILNWYRIRRAYVDTLIDAM